MGVDRYDYVMFGINLDYKSVDEWYDEFEDEICGAPRRRFDLVPDFMSGKFCIAGKILANAGDKYSGFDLTTIKPEDVDKTELAQTLSEAFLREVKPKEFQLFVFSTFS